MRHRLDQQVKEFKDATEALIDVVSVPLIGCLREEALERWKVDFQRGYNYPPGVYIRRAIHYFHKHDALTSREWRKLQAFMATM